MNVRETKEVMKRIEKWSKSYKMQISREKKKSAILFVSTKNHKLTKWETKTK